MIYNWRNLFFGFLVLALLFLPVASTLSVDIDSPLNKSYPYSNGIALDFTNSSDATSCYYTVNGGIQNFTIPNCFNTTFSVDFDASYNFTLFVDNGTDIRSDSVMFSVERNFGSGMGMVAIGIIFAVASLIFFCGVVAKFLGEKFGSLNYFFFGLAFIFIIVTINVAYTFSAEFLKVPAFESLLLTTFWIVFWILFALMCYFILYVFFYQKWLKKMEDITDVKI